MKPRTLILQWRLLPNATDTLDLVFQCSARRQEVMGSGDPFWEPVWPACYLGAVIRRLRLQEGVWPGAGFEC